MILDVTERLEPGFWRIWTGAETLDVIVYDQHDGQRKVRGLTFGPCKLEDVVVAEATRMVVPPSPRKVPRRCDCQDERPTLPRWR